MNAKEWYKYGLIFEIVFNFENECCVSITHIFLKYIILSGWKADKNLFPHNKKKYTGDKNND